MALKNDWRARGGTFRGSTRRHRVLQQIGPWLGPTVLVRYIRQIEPAWNHLLGYHLRWSVLTHGRTRLNNEDGFAYKL
jgi:hypothetical protein